MRLVADIETDGLLDTVTKIHCIAVMNADNPEQTWVFSKEQVAEGVQLLQTASELIFHNGITFDVVCIKKLYPHFNTDNITVTNEGNNTYNINLADDGSLSCTLAEKTLTCTYGEAGVTFEKGQ